jgi:tocopherol O-methyltransferase
VFGTIWLLSSHATFGFDSQLSEGIAGFYDRSSALWEDVWGEHMHHGYYPTHLPAPESLADHCTAQIDMIDKARSTI